MNRILWIFFVLGCFFIIYKCGYAHKNNSDKYIGEYKKGISSVKLYIPKYIPSKLSAEYNFDYKVYKRGISLIGFKGLSGEIYTLKFYDSTVHKNFVIDLFDFRTDQTMALTTVLDDIAIYAYVNQDDLKNPKYGTKENPIPIFNFKGVKEPIEITSSKPDGSDTMRSLEPTPQEYEHNVRTYLTYIMSGKEFDERFK